jgi:hypothetical protein
MNLILIDLKQYNHPKLDELAKQFNWPVSVLFMFKEGGIAKIWVNLDTKDVVAFTTKKDSTIQLGHEFSEKLSKMTPYQLPKKEKIIDSVLDLDTILEKISAKGINSLTNEEKNYLSSKK